ncbi:MAG: T9SS type A sorting domain-containing protein, partial [Bacteroidetes bacterium]|nr:T9SS type A sorting domain-containing protein [Bacteroidota bacterium]
DVDYYPEDIVVCQDGGYAVNGYYYYYNPEFQIEEQWGFLMKTDSDGNLLWAHTDEVDFMNENKSFAFVETSDGGFISGCSWGVLIKRDSEGNREWVIDSDFGINSMSNTTDGNIITGGAQNLNIGLRKIDEEGNTIWTQVYQIDNDYSICNSIIQTQNEGFALTGYIDYEDRQVADIIVMKTDENGDSLWTSTYDGYGLWDIGKSITEDSDGNIMVAGEITQNRDIIGFLWYIDEEGSTIWIEEADHSLGHSHYSVISQPDNNFITYCYSGYGGYRETTIYSFDNNYNVNWQSEFETNVARGDKSIKSLNNENFIFSVRAVGGAYELNMGLVKTDSQGLVTSIDNEIIFVTDFKLINYPNPFNSLTTISFETTNFSQNSRIEIFNINGQKIKEYSIFNNQSSILWDGTDQLNKPVSSGVYLYRLKTNDKYCKTKKMILKK